MTGKIGLIGCGRWGSLILRDLLACGAEVHVACRSTESNEKALALGARSAQSEIAALEGMDGFVVATPSATHAEVVGRLLATGRPIFVEKPLTTDLASARRLAAQAGDRVFVMDKWRYHPGIEAIRREIATGYVGDVLSIRMMRWGWGNPHSDASLLWHLAPHDLAIVLHLIGTIPPVRAAFPVSSTRSELGLYALLGDGRGPDISIDIGSASPEHRRSCTVVGSHATLQLRGGYEEQVFVREGGPGDLQAPSCTIGASGRLPLLAEIEIFLAFLSGGPPPMSSAQEALLVVERLAQIEALLGAEPQAGR